MTGSFGAYFGVEHPVRNSAQDLPSTISKYGGTQPPQVIDITILRMYASPSKTVDLFQEILDEAEEYSDHFLAMVGLDLSDDSSLAWANYLESRGKAERGFVDTARNFQHQKYRPGEYAGVFNHSEGKLGSVFDCQEQVVLSLVGMRTSIEELLDLLGK